MNELLLDYGLRSRLHNLLVLGDAETLAYLLNSPARDMREACEAWKAAETDFLEILQFLVDDETVTLHKSEMAKFRETVIDALLSSARIG